MKDQDRSNENVELHHILDAEAANLFIEPLKKNGVQEIKSLAELKKLNLYIIEDDDTVVKMRLPQVLKEKGLLVADLARLSGLSRQHINAVIRNKMNPGIDFALKVSFVLSEPIENLFQLTDNAWIRPFKVGRDSCVFVDVLHLRLLNSSMRTEQLKKDPVEYFNKSTKETYSKESYESMLKSYVRQNIDMKERKIANQKPELGRSSVNSQAIESLKNDFMKDYSKIYKKLGQKFVPYSMSN